MEAPKPNSPEENRKKMEQYFAPGERGVAKNYDANDVEVDSYENLKKTKSEKDPEDDNSVESEARNLEIEVAEARKKYAKIDYDEDKKVGLLKRILGKHIGNVKTQERKEAFSQYREKLEALSSYKVNELKKGGFDEKELESRVEEIAKYFDTDEKISLYETRTNIRTEAWEEKTGGKMIKKAGEFVNWYRKQNVWAKGAVGVALAASGLAVGAFGLGAAAAAAVGVGATGMRVMGGAAAGVGTSAALEARHRAKEGQKAQEKRTELTKQLEGKEAEDKLNFLLDGLKKEMDTYEGSLEGEKAKGMKRRALGLGVGALIGSGALGYLVRGVSHLAGSSEVVKNVSSYVASTDIMKTTTSFWKSKLENLFTMKGTAFAETVDGVSEHGGTPSAASGVEAASTSKDFPFKDGDYGIRKVPEVSIKKDLPVLDAKFMQEHGIGLPNKEVVGTSFGGDETEAFKKGPSLSEAEIIQYNRAQGVGIPDDGFMDSHPKEIVSSGQDAVADQGAQEVKIEKIGLEVKKGSSLEKTIINHLKVTGMSVDEAGTRAHQMALEYAEENNLAKGAYSLIHPGAQIEIVDGKIVNISGDPKLGYLKQNVVAGVDQKIASEASVVTVEEMDKSSIMPVDKGTGLEKAGVANVEDGDVKKPLNPRERMMQQRIADMVAKNNMGYDPASVETPSLVNSSEISVGYSYENFSSDVDSSMRELAKARENIFSEYEGEINSDSDVHNKIKFLEEKEAQANIGGSGNVLNFSPLNVGEKQQLEELTAYREAFKKTYNKMLDSFFDARDEEKISALEMDANSYLTENKGSRAAQIFDGLTKTMTQEEIVESNIKPKSGEKVANWSRRVINILYKRKMESIHN